MANSKSMFAVYSDEIVGMSREDAQYFVLTVHEIASMMNDHRNALDSQLQTLEVELVRAEVAS